MSQRRQSDTSSHLALNSDVAERTLDDARLETSPPMDEGPSQTPEERHDKSSMKEEENGQSGDESDADDTDVSIGQRRDSAPAPAPAPIHDKDVRTEEDHSSLSSQMAQMLAMMSQMQQRLQEVEGKVDHGLARHQPKPQATPEMLPTIKKDAAPDPPPEAPRSPNAYQVNHISPQLERRITTFQEKAKAVSQPISLKGSRNYEDWKRNILDDLPQLSCRRILESQEEDCPSSMYETKELWDTQNQWLYDHIWESVDSFFQKKLRVPEKRSAFLLWAEIEACFNKSLEEERRLALYLLYTYRCSDDGEFINGFKERVQDIRMLGFTVPDWILMDLLWMGLSEQSRDFVQLQIESKRGPKYLAVTLNVEQLLDDLLNYLSSSGAAIYKASPHPIGSSKESDEKRSDSSTSQGNIDRRLGESQSASSCRYCGMANHIQRKCLYRNPELATAKWQKANKHVVEFLRTQSENRRFAQRTPGNGCVYCGIEGHVEDNCAFKHPEKKSATWQKQKKGAIEYFRKRAERSRVEPYHLDLVAKDVYRMTTQDARLPPRPQPENLLIMDL